MRTLFDPPSSHEPTSPAAPATPTIRPDGQRACAVCGAPAPFGFGVRLFHKSPTPTKISEGTGRGLLPPCRPAS